jgi:hypothetical protein
MRPRDGSTTPSLDSATLVLTRERHGYRDLFRRYAVMVDDAQVAKVKRGQTLRVPVSPGPHEVHLRIDWCRSPSVDIDASPGAVIKIYCAPAGGLTEAYDALVNPEQYIIARVVE